VGELTFPKLEDAKLPITLFCFTMKSIIKFSMLYGNWSRKISHLFRYK